MKTFKMLKSPYLKKSDAKSDLTLTISNCSLRTMPGDAGEKHVLHFQQNAKLLPLNDTSIKTLEQAFGDDSDDWIGETIIVFVDPTIEFRGERVGGLRLRPVKLEEAPAAPVASRKATAEGAEFDDSIPF